MSYQRKLGECFFPELLLLLILYFMLYKTYESKNHSLHNSDVFAFLNVNISASIGVGSSYIILWTLETELQFYRLGVDIQEVFLQWTLQRECTLLRNTSVYVVLPLGVLGIYGTHCTFSWWENSIRKSAVLSGRRQEVISVVTGVADTSSRT
jgi:hypothetical protein